MRPPTIIIFARWPEAGKAKTRLIPALGAEGAARVYRRLLSQTLDTVRASGLPFVLRSTGAPPERFREAFGADLSATDQGEGDLADRLGRVAPPALVIGSDCPGLTPAILRTASDAVARGDVAIGPARDGGYYLLGFAGDIRFAFRDIAWSTDAVFEQTMRHFADRGIAPLILPELADVDTPADLGDWPDLVA